MPTYEITIPGKGTFEVSSEQELTDAQAYQAAFQQANAAPAETERQRLLNIPYSDLMEVANTMPSQEPIQFGPVGQTIRGLVKGAVVDPLTGIAQVLGGEKTRKTIAEGEQAYQQRRKEEGATGLEWSRLIGNVASSILPGGAAAKGAQALGAGKVLSGVSAGVGGAAALPVTQTPEEAADPSTFAQQKLKDIGFSGAVGGAVAKIGAALTPELRAGVREQLEAGVRVPAGQAYGGVPGWVFRQMESVGFGPSERAIRRSFTRSAGNEVLKSIDETVPKNIKDGMQMSGYIQNRISSFYDKAFDKLGKVVPDNQFADDLSNVVADNLPNMSPRAQKIFQTRMQQEIIDRFKLGPVPKGAVAPQGMRQLPAADGLDLKGIDKFLKKQVETFGKKTGADNEALAAGFEDALNAFRAYTTRVDKDGLIAKADEAWANLYRFADATSSSQGARMAGSFGPTELSQAAIRQATPLQAGAGQGPMGEFARKGVEVLGEQPEVLTAGYRQAVIAGKIGTGTALALFNPQVFVPVMVASGLSYKAAEQLLKNPSAARVVMEQAIQKLGPQTVSSILAREERKPATVE
jgi:hypothetical protein